MTSAERKTHWDAIYTTRPEATLSWFEPSPQRSLALISRLAPNPAAAILDIGAGNGHLVDLLLQQGYRSICVLDISSHALAQSRSRLGKQAEQVTWIEEDVLDWSPPGHFRLWHDRAVYHFFTEPADRERYVRTAARAVEPGGSLILQTFAPTGPEFCSGLPVYRPSPQDVARQFSARFDLRETSEHIHTTPNGDPQLFQTAILSRR
jgi:SAM-dependent methyltransferase